MRLVFGMDVPSEILKLIDNTQKTLILVSPYLDAWTHLTNAIARARHRGVTVVMILRGGDDRAKQEAAAEKFVEMGVVVRFVERLHAKLYIGDKTAIVTSLNLLRSSMEGSWEIGTVFTEQKDPHAFKELMVIFKKLGELVKADKAMNGQEGEVKKQARKLVKQADKAASGRRRTSKNPGSTGFCIRCHADIRLSPARPLCRSCYSDWSKWENPDYKEKHCHQCGKKASTSMAKPLCRKCFKAA